MSLMNFFNIFGKYKGMKTMNASKVKNALMMLLV